MLMKPATPFALATLRSLDSLSHMPNDVLTQSRYNNVPYSQKKAPSFFFPTTALVSFLVMSWHILLCFASSNRHLLSSPEAPWVREVHGALEIREAPGFGSVGVYRHLGCR